MASQEFSSNQKAPLDAEEELHSAFAVLARAPLPMRPEYASQLRNTLRNELTAQAAGRGRPRWLAWLSPSGLAAQPASRTVQRRAPTLRFAMAGVVALMLVVLTGVTVTQLYPLGPGAQMTTLQVSAGEVQIARPVRIFVDIGLMRSITVSPGEQARLRSGDQLASNTAAAAVIALPDGSRMQVGPGAQLTMDALQARTASQPLVVAMRLERGEVLSQVEHLRADRDRFEVTTPNLVAQVRGTIFRVDVRSAGTRVATDRGVVRVNWDGQTLDVEAGRELQVLLGASVPEVHVQPQSPALSHNLSGVEVDVNAQGEQVIYTNELFIPWRIQTLPGVKVSLIVDDEPFISAVSGSDGVVDINLDLAQEGVHRITAVMETLSGERSLPAPTQVLVLDRTLPSLLLTSPPEPQVTGKTVWVAGRTDPDVRLLLNEVPLVVDQAGEFKYELPLAPGSNEIILVATDRANNSIKLQSVIISESATR